MAEKVDRPNVGVMFNLCHWLRVDQSRDCRSLLHRAMPRLWAVSINGADVHDEKPGWDHYIQPLDRGSFDVAGLLKTLDELGYKGPIGLSASASAATPASTWPAPWPHGGKCARRFESGTRIPAAS